MADSIDVNDKLAEALQLLAEARTKEEEDLRRSQEKIQLLESVVAKLEQIKKRQDEDSSILKKT